MLWQKLVWRNIGWADETVSFARWTDEEIVENFSLVENLPLLSLARFKGRGDLIKCEMGCAGSAWPQHGSIWMSHPHYARIRNARRMMPLLRAIAFPEEIG